MKNLKNLSMASATTLLFLIVASSLMASSGFEIATANASSSSSGSSPSDYWEPGRDYGDLMQYEWPSIQGQPYPGHTGTYRSLGPAPNAPDILWKITINDVLPAGYTLSNYIYAFNGKVFIRIQKTLTTGGLVAIDAFTGEKIYQVTNLTDTGFAYSGGPAGVGLWKISDDLMVFGRYCLRISDGSIVWIAQGVTLPNGDQVVFSPRHSWPGGDRYDPETKMFFTSGGYISVTAVSPFFNPSGTTAWNLSDPTEPPVPVWTNQRKFAEGASATIYGDGVVSGGTTQGYYRGFNATTGELMWETECKGEMGYDGIYYQGKFIRGGTTDNTVYAFDAKTGKILWTYCPVTWMGYWASAPAAAYGMVYYINNDHYIYAIDAETGKLVWKHQGAIYYQGWPIVADGKVFVTTEVVNAVDWELGRAHLQARYSALDAFTGEEIWSIPYSQYSDPMNGHCIAYGNLYILPNVLPRELWCIGSPSDWPMWRHDPAQTAKGQSGPSKLNLMWAYQTGGGVTSSPAVADGKVYVGSQDKYLYCLDAWTGELIWKTKIGSRIRSSPAVVNGRVYLGPDDGYVYCFNATTGQVLWKKDAGASVLKFDVSGNPIFVHLSAPIQSSPIVVDGKVYVGSIANKTYCFDAITGTLIWSFPTKGPVVSSPVVLGNDLYITCHSNGTLYKLDANTGALKKIIWVPGTGGTYTTSTMYMYPSPTVVGDGAQRVIYYPAQSTFWYAINETTGKVIWRFRYKESFATRNEYSMLYYAPLKGVIIVDRFNMMMLSTTNITSWNPVTKEYEPQVIWSCYLAREVQSTPTLAMVGPNDGKIYVSTDSRIIWVINASNGAKLGWYDRGDVANGWSSAALWEGNMYVGNSNNYVYAFREHPKTQFSIQVCLSKTEANVNETLTISGQITPILNSETVTVFGETRPATIWGEKTPTVPNLPVKVSIIQPDGKTLELSTKADEQGMFTLSYKPTKEGDYSITAWFQGYKYYNYAYSDSQPLKATKPSTPPPPPPPPPGGEQAGIPTEYIYAAAIIIVIVIIAAAGYMLMKKRKK